MSHLLSSVDPVLYCDTNGPTRAPAVLSLAPSAASVSASSLVLLRVVRFLGLLRRVHCLCPLQQLRCCSLYSSCFTPCFDLSNATAPANHQQCINQSPSPNANYESIMNQSPVAVNHQHTTTVMMIRRCQSSRSNHRSIVDQSSINQSCSVEFFIPLSLVCFDCFISRSVLK